MTGGEYTGFNCISNGVFLKPDGGYTGVYIVFLYCSVCLSHVILICRSGCYCFLPSFCIQTAYSGFLVFLRRFSLDFVGFSR